MRWTFALASTACLLWAASSAQAQSGHNSRRSLMAAPDAPASKGYVRRVAATRHQDPQPVEAAAPATSEPASPSDAAPAGDFEGIEGSGYQPMNGIYQAPRGYGWDGYGGNCDQGNPWCEGRPCDEDGCGRGACDGGGCGGVFGGGDGC